MPSATSEQSLIFDRDLLLRRRNRHAGHAAAHDFLLARVGEDFAERLELIKRRFPLAANIGAHHGLISR
ncbi:MAG: SAM-dependent methyltransferase, partial [Hyphomicrobium sp.]